MSGKIGIAFVGGGIFVKEAHLPAVQRCDELELKAVYPRSLKSAKNCAEGLSNVDLYSDDSDKKYKDLLARSDVKAVILALPITVQPQFIKEALSAGKHVLAEKPLAKDVGSGKELLDWYHENINTSKVFFGVAEQFRYVNAFLYGAQRAREYGRVLGFRLKLGAFVQPDGSNKYFETEWRKKPEYQGGFLLDGGVHYIAGMRMLLGADAKVTKVSAFTSQLQPHLPPVDSVDATFKLANGSTGSFSVSFGTTFSGAEWSVACENGTVSVSGSKVTTRPKGRGEKVEEKTEDKPDEDGGVANEVIAWAKSLMSGKPDEEQSPEEALADLEILEAMVKSGEDGGVPVEVKYQV